MSQTEGPNSKERRASRIEAIIALLSAVLVLAILGVLVFQAKRSGTGFPDLQVKEQADAAPGQLRFQIVNHGEQAAASVTVSLILRDGDAVVDKRTALIDFVPSHSRAAGAFLLGPGDDGLARALVVESYLDP